MEMNSKEIWKDIEGYEGYYKVSNFGRIASLREWIGNKYKSQYKSIFKIIPSHHNKKGYQTIILSKDKKTKYYMVHRLVAKAFIENPYNKPQVNHIDGNKNNNNVSNLEWCTCKENIKHAFDKGLMTTKSEARNTHLEKIRPLSIEVMKKKVAMLSNKGEILKVFDCITEANEFLNVNRKSSNITNCCKGRKKSAYGYKWKYYNEIYG